MGGRRVDRGGRESAARAPRFEGFAPSSERASATARAIKRTDTKAELALRRALWALGLRYRKHARSIPGRPDIVFAGARVVVFVDGDFWHGRDWEGRRAKLAAGSNALYWLAKIEANMDRDRRKDAALRDLGWTVVRLWERDVLASPDAAANVVATHVAAGLARRPRKGISSRRRSR